MRNALPLILTFLLACAATRARADYHIVVNASNPQPALTRSEVLNIFMGRNRAFANGDFALVFDLPRDDPKREGFYRSLTGMSLAKITSYWSRLSFSGQCLPPQPVPDESAMIEIVKNNPHAVGWLRTPPTDKGLHTVLILEEAP